jgi:ketosteroid isomerase-like protein
MFPDIKTFVNEWIAAWNSHDIDKIMNYYAEDVEVSSPIIKIAFGIDSGTLIGKDNVRKYWGAALEKVPDLRFELIEVAQGINSVAIYHRAIENMMLIEVMFFNDKGKISRVVAHYN